MSTVACKRCVYKNKNRKEIELCKEFNHRNLIIFPHIYFEVKRFVQASHG